MDWKEVSEHISARRGRLAFDDQSLSEPVGPGNAPVPHPPYVANIGSRTGLRSSWGLEPADLTKKKGCITCKADPKRCDQPHQGSS
eukprot:6394810-Ditylum_brightwellii.AAC.1